MSCCRQVAALRKTISSGWKRLTQTDNSRIDLRSDRWGLITMDFMKREIRYFNTYGRSGATYLHKASLFANDEHSRLQSDGCTGLSSTAGTWKLVNEPENMPKHDYEVPAPEPRGCGSAFSEQHSHTSQCENLWYGG